MSVYKDEERNTWYVCVRYENWTGERKQKKKRGFLTKKEAVIWEREFLQKQSANIDMAFKAFVDVYFNDMDSRLKERSIKNKKYMIEAKVTPFFGSKAMNTIKPADIIKWQNEMLERGYSATYLRMLQNQVSAIFNHAERLYGLFDNPCKKVSKIGRSNARELNFWTIDEYRLFEKSLPDEEVLYKTLFALLFWTGCRIGEALALTKQDLDFDNLTISISKTYYRHDKRDVITSPKTEASIRTISMPVHLSEILQTYLGMYYGGLDADIRMFQITDRAVQKKLVKYAEIAGIKRIRVHDLRHSHIALLIEKGISPLAIAQRVGHDSINTTMNIYGHLYPNKQKEVAEKLDKLMGAGI